MDNLDETGCLNQIIDEINRNIDINSNNNLKSCDQSVLNLIDKNLSDYNSLIINNSLLSDLKINDNLNIVKMNGFITDSMPNYQIDQNNKNDKLLDHKDNNEIVNLPTSVYQTELIDNLTIEQQKNLINQPLSCDLSIVDKKLINKELLKENGQDDFVLNEIKKCHCVPRYSHLIHELPSLETALANSGQNDDHLSIYSNNEHQNKYQSILHLIQSTKEQNIAQLNGKKQITIEQKDQKSRLINFDTIIESNKQASISNDYYLDLSLSVLPDLIQNCLNGNDSLLIQSGSSESHDIIIGPTGLFQFSINWLFDGLKKLNTNFAVRCTAAQFDTEQFIDLFAKHKLSKAPSKSSRFLNKSILNHLYEIRCSNSKKLAQALEIAINNNRKLINLTSSNENILLITFHIYQYEIRKSIGNPNEKTAIGGCSRFHLLDISPNFYQTANILNNLINDSPNKNQSKFSLKKDQKANKIWPKFNEETNKISELFQEFLINQSCSISIVGSFENKQTNYNQINKFCDLAEQLNSFRYFNKQNYFNGNRLKNEELSFSNEYLPNKMCSRRNSIKYQLKNLRMNQTSSNSLPRRLSSKHGSRKSNDEYKENIKKIVLKRKHLQNHHSKTTTMVQIDGPNCKLTDNELEYSSINESSINTFNNNNSSINSSENSSKSNELIINNDLLTKQKRIENWIKQQQMADKNVELFKSDNDQMSPKILNKSSTNLTNRKINENYCNKKEENTILDKYKSLNLHFNNLNSTINRRSIKTELNDLNNFKESPFKYMTTNSLNRKNRFCVLKTQNYQEKFKLSCSSTEDDWSSKEDDEESEQKLIEDNLHFFNTNFFKHNFQLNPTTLSDDGSTFLNDHQIDLNSNKRIKNQQIKTIDSEIENLDKNKIDLSTEPPKQLKLEQFLKQLVNSTINSQSDIRDSLNNLSIGSLSNIEKIKHKSPYQTELINKTELNKSKCCSIKTNNSNTSSSTTTSSGIHLSSSKETTSKHDKHNCSTINSKMDLNSIKSFDYKENLEDLKKDRNSIQNNGVNSSGHGSIISETESIRIINNNLKDQNCNKKFTNNINKNSIQNIRNKQPSCSSEFNITLLQDKIESYETIKKLNLKKIDSDVILKNQSAICNKSRNQNLFCCGLF